MQPKVSIIVPVHNSEAFLLKSIKNLLKQDYENYEILLIENGSLDGSFKICEKLQNIDSHIRSFQNPTAGTSLARKKGIEEADGEYIVFFDQDDHYARVNAITRMVEAIVSDKCDIVQFGYYKEYFPYLMKKVCFTKDNRIIQREELLTDNIQSVFGIGSSGLTPNVWSKIYKAKVLKASSNQIRDPMFFGDDILINCLALLGKDCTRVSIRPEAHYVWNAGVGLSSSVEGSFVLFHDFEYLKPIEFQLIKSLNLPQYEYPLHMESYSFFKYIVFKMIWGGGYPKDYCKKN